MLRAITTRGRKYLKLAAGRRDKADDLKASEVRGASEHVDAGGRLNGVWVGPALHERRHQL